MPAEIRWWETLSDEEREELHRWYAEVNAVNDRIPGPSEDREPASVGTSEAF